MVGNRFTERAGAGRAMDEDCGMDAGAGRNAVHDADAGVGNVTGNGGLYKDGLPCESVVR